jgi:hypothetical protein
MIVLYKLDGWLAGDYKFSCFSECSNPCRSTYFVNSLY